MLPGPLKRFALRFLPEMLLHKLKKIHYARALRAASDQGEPDLKIVRHLVEPGCRVVDIGANFGVYTRFLSERVGPSGRVLSIEPMPPTYDILISNLRKLKLTNVEPFHLAISDADCQVRMEVPRYASGGSNYYEARITQAEAKSRGGVEIAARTLDSLFADGSPIDFIKCDVEAHELACLRGAARILKQWQPAWLIEVFGSPDHAGSSARQVFELLLSHGYQAFWFDGRCLRPRQHGERSVNFFFLTPRQVRQIPEDLLRGWPTRMPALAA